MSVIRARARIPIMHGTDEDWKQANPILLEGELGYNTTLNQVKIGNGVDTFDKLNYLVNPIPELEIASRTKLGGIKVGENLEILQDGTLNAKAGGSSKPSYIASDIAPEDTSILWINTADKGTEIQNNAIQFVEKINEEKAESGITYFEPIVTTTKAFSDTKYWVDKAEGNFAFFIVKIKDKFYMLQFVKASGNNTSAFTDNNGVIESGGEYQWGWWLYEDNGKEWTILREHRGNSTDMSWYQMLEEKLGSSIPADKFKDYIVWVNTTTGDKFNPIYYTKVTDTGNNDIVMFNNADNQYTNNGYAINNFEYKTYDGTLKRYLKNSNFKIFAEAIKTSFNTNTV